MKRIALIFSLLFLALGVSAQTTIQVQNNGTTVGTYKKFFKLNLVNSGCVVNNTTGALDCTFAGAGGGSVTGFSANALAPLFTVSVANQSTTPALSFTLSSAAANKVFGNCTTGSASPSFCSLTAAMIPDISATYAKLTAGVVNKDVLAGLNPVFNSIVGQPSTDAPGLVARRNTAGQTSYVLEVQTEANGHLAGAKADGTFDAKGFTQDGARLNFTHLAAGNIPIGSYYVDMAEISAPANPAAGSCRFWVDSTTHQITFKNSGGTSCIASGGATLPANALGYLHNDGAGTLAWGTPSGTESTPALSEDETSVTSSKELKVPSIAIGAAGNPTVLNITSQTVASLPGTGNAAGDQRQVSDGADASDCTVGSGSTVHWCYWTGTAWMSSVSTSLTPAGSSGDLQTNNGSGALGSVTQSTFAKNISNGTATLGTGAISSATCATAVTVSATGVATTDVITAGFSGDPTGVTGYIPSTSGGLSIFAYPTANNVNFKVCNFTSSSITPGSALVINWKVVR